MLLSHKIYKNLYLQSIYQQGLSFFFLGFSTIVLQAFCHHKFRFTACYLGWSEPVHDGQVFSNSNLNMQLSENMFSFLLKNLFICSNSFQDNSYLNTMQKHNYIYSFMRNAVYRAPRLLKSKLPHLRKID